MIIFLPLKQEEHWRWASDRAGFVICADSTGIVALDDEGDPCAAIVFDSWTENSACAHIVIESRAALKAGIVQEAADYVFNTCGRKMVIGNTPSDNEAALRINRHIGFKEVARIPNCAKDNVDVVIQVMNREDCRYLNGKAESAKAA